MLQPLLQLWSHKLEYILPKACHVILGVHLCLDTASVLRLSQAASAGAHASAAGAGLVEVSQAHGSVPVPDVQTPAGAAAA